MGYGIRETVYSQEIIIPCKPGAISRMECEVSQGLQLLCRHTECRPEIANPSDRVRAFQLFADDSSSFFSLIYNFRIPEGKSIKFYSPKNVLVTSPKNIPPSTTHLQFESPSDSLPKLLPPITHLSLGPSFDFPLVNLPTSLTPGKQTRLSVVAREFDGRVIFEKSAEGAIAKGILIHLSYILKYF